MLSHLKEISLSSRWFSEDEPVLYSFVSLEQLMLHVLAYAEVLFRWKLLHKRIELLKAVDPFLRLPSHSPFHFDHSELGRSFLSYDRCPLLTVRSWDRCIHTMHSVW